MLVVQHEYPCVDVNPQWLEHPNGALGIMRLTVLGQGGTPMPDSVARACDLSWLHFDPVGATAPLRITLRVRSIAMVTAALERNGIRYQRDGETVRPIEHGELAVDWEFVE
jgi:hypothetical protein